MLNNRTISIRSWAMRLALAVIVASCLPSQSLAQVPSMPSGPAAGPARRRPVSRSLPVLLLPTSRKNRPPRPSTLIDAAIKKIAKLESVAADLLQEINMLNQKYTIKGRYLEGTEFACLPQTDRLRPA